ncbi:hypothetical protein F5I97DRAFT_373646 [Phlebopus sp. FC_14]|nr:hypothetical protein F5I97DRAFT_373646 [Phlebopus sp. FC_14]
MDRPSVLEQGGESQSQAQTQTQSGTQSGQPSQTGSQSQSGSTAAPMPTIPQNAPAGLLTVTQPPQQSTSYFKIAENQPITFAWNFSYILATPTHLTVSAVCENGNTYPVGPTNGIIPGTATNVIWDTYSYQTSHPQLPLAQAKYTLKIWGDQGPDAPRAPGYLTPNSALQFALYTPQPYTPIGSGWTCAGCSSAISQYMAQPAFTGLVATLLIMFLSGSVLLRRI